MTEHDIAFAFDQALDGTHTHDLNGAEPLVQTAAAVQSLFDRLQAVPSEEFVMQLEHSLFVTPAAPAIIPSAIEGPPAAAVSRPMPHPPFSRDVATPHRYTHSRLLAVAAVLVLLIGGMGAILSGPLDPRRDPEPSAIPAAFFGTVEASPAASTELWTVEPPVGTQGLAARPVTENELLYSLLSGPNGVTARVVDLETRAAIWSHALSTEPTFAVWRDHLLVTGTGGPSYELFAFAGRTGEEQWSIPVEQRPVNLIVDGNVAFLLGSGNLVQAFDLETRQQRWQADLSAFDPNQSAYGGQNRYIFMRGGRLAIAEDMLAVVTSSGRLVALDVNDGSEQWANDQMNDGRMTLDVIADRFVVIAEGKSIFDMDDDPYLVPATPIPSYDPKSQPCERTIEHWPAADTSELGDLTTGVTSLDPESGQSRWAVRTQAAVWLFPADAEDLLAMIRPGWDPSLGNEDFSIYCRIAGDDGSLSRTSGLEFVDVVVRGDDPSVPWGIGGTSDGLPLYMPLQPGEAQAFPMLDVDFTTHMGVRWIQHAKDLILISMQDGTIFGLPKDAKRWAAPNKGTTVSDASDEPGHTLGNWRIEAPQGTTGQMLIPTNGHDEIFRVLYQEDGYPKLQAIEIATGHVLWTNDLDGWPGLGAFAADTLFLVVSIEPASGASNLLIALDPETGVERWRMQLDGLPVAMIGNHDRLTLLDTNNVITVLDGGHQALAWQTDLTPYIDESNRTPEFVYIGARLALHENLLAAITDKGDLVAVDADDGAYRWSVAAQLSGPSEVHVVDGVFAVTNSDQGGNTSVWSASVDGTPEVGDDAHLSLCEQAFPAATLGVAEETAAIADVLAIEPATGAVLWSRTSPDRVLIEPLTDTTLIAFARAASGTKTRLAYCLIEGTTGSIIETDHLEPVFTFQDADSGATVGLVALPNGSQLPVDVDHATTQRLPFSDVVPVGVQLADGIFVIADRDGTLIGLPEDATPALASP